MRILANIDYWLAGILFIGSQLVRSAALRTFVSEIQVFRLRDIIGLNSAASLLNILGPFRAGDILRIYILSARGLGVAPSVFSIGAERSLDFGIILFLSLALGANVLYAVIAVALLLMTYLSIYLFARNLKENPRNGFFLGKIIELREFFALRDFIDLFLKLLLAWVIAFLGVLLIDSKHTGFLDTWISWNSKFGEPFTLLISRNHFLIIVLILPIIGLALSSLLFKNSTQVANHAFRETQILNSFEKNSVHRITSKFSGSGCDIYVDDSGPGMSGVGVPSLMCKVEPKSRSFFLSTQAEFMKAQRSQFDFPNVYGLGTTANFNYVVMENIVNFNTGHQSENYASLISKSDNRKSQELLTELIIFLSSGKTAGLTIASDSHSQILQQRLRRVVAFCSVKKPITEKITRRDAHFRKNVEEISRLLQKTFNYDTKRVSHGDATLSNFLRQETAESFRIRAIDPNPRVPIGRLEFDFGKIMQSIDSMYEDTLLNPDLVDLGLEGYLERYSVNSNTEFLINAIQKNNPNIDMGLLHLFHLTHLIRILPYQQKNGAKHVHYWQDIINYKFEEHFK